MAEEAKQVVLSGEQWRALAKSRKEKGLSVTGLDSLVKPCRKCRKEQSVTDRLCETCYEEDKAPCPICKDGYLLPPRTMCSECFKVNTVCRKCRKVIPREEEVGELCHDCFNRHFLCGGCKKVLTCHPSQLCRVCSKPQRQNNSQFHCSICLNIVSQPGLCVGCTPKARACAQCNGAFQSLHPNATLCQPCFHQQQQQHQTPKKCAYTWKQNNQLNYCQNMTQGGKFCANCQELLQSRTVSRRF